MAKSEGGGVQPSPKRSLDERVAEAAQHLPRLQREYLRRPGVTAVDVGFCYRGRERTDEVALRVHVERKIPTAALAEHERITSSDDPVEIGGFRVDVVEATYAPATLTDPPTRSRLAPVGDETALSLEGLGLGVHETLETVDRRGRVDPLVAGVSCGNPRVTAGTLGAIVWDRESGEASLLSNWHVLCGSPAAAVGEAIVQPGALDGGSPAVHRVATLARWRLDEDADAAVATLTGERPFVRDVVGGAPFAGVEEPRLGMPVRKSGRTTGVTEGFVDGLHLSLALDYGGGVVQSFRDQVRIVPRPPWPAVDYEASRGGDSGSVWVHDATGRAVGLHFAGERDPAPASEHAVANRMTRVAELLRVSLTPLFRRRPPDPVRRPPRVDAALLARLRRLICRHFPFACGGRPFPGPDAAAWNGADGDGRHAAHEATCPACGRAYERHDPVEALALELLDELAAR